MKLFFDTSVLVPVFSGITLSFTMGMRFNGKFKH